jgi:DNA-binding winged helix-turn-helix (wHTH) protein
MDGHPISFGPYRLLAAQRLLLEGDRPVRLGSRAFDILAALVERAGDVVGKEQLIARAWPQTFVEESNLKIQVSALRRALGDGQGGNRYVITVPGRGYNFVASVRREETLRAAPAPPVPSTTPNNLPFAVTRMIGRDDAAAALVARLSRERLDPERKLRSCLLDDPIGEGDCCGEAAALTQINVGSPPEGRGSRWSVR